MFDLDEEEAARAVAEVLCAEERDPAEFAGRGDLGARLALRMCRYSKRLATGFATLRPRPVPDGLEGLSEAQREVIVLSVAGRIAYRDIADVLDVDARWVAAELRSGLVALTDHAVTRTGLDGLAGVHADDQVERGRQLHEALHRRAVMDQAKGLLMSLHGCDPDRASALLTQVSKERKLGVHDLAGALVALAAGGGQAPLPTEVEPQSAIAASGASGDTTGGSPGTRTPEWAAPPSENELCTGARDLSW